MWPELVIVYRKPRHPQSQASVKRSNGEIHMDERQWIQKMVNWDKICPVAKKFCPQQKNWTITLRSSLWVMRNCRFNLGDQNSERNLSHPKCSCNSKCSSNRCKCKKNGVLCNSRCHSSGSCDNKWFLKNDFKYFHKTLFFNILSYLAYLSEWYSFRNYFYFRYFTF